MALSKERLREIYGIIESTDPPDPAVVARRGMHEAALKWVAKYLTPWTMLIILIDFFTILLPALSKSWRVIIETIPVLNIFPNLFGWHGLSLMFGIFIPVFFAHMRWDKYSPSYSKYPGQVPLKDFIKMECYPKTKRQETAYWLGLFKLVLMPIIIYSLPFMMLAMLLRR